VDRVKLTSLLWSEGHHLRGYDRETSVFEVREDLSYEVASCRVRLDDREGSLLCHNLYLSFGSNVSASSWR
jgi:hypothetical protein